MKILSLIILLSISSTSYFDVDRKTAFKQAMSGNENAFALLVRTAENGCPIAQGMIGFIYYTGKGAEKNYTKAFKWTKKSASKGRVQAQGLLGEMHYYGRGTKKDYRKAFKTFKEASKEGDIIAQRWLGKLYYLGQGTERDFIQAYKWWSVSKFKNGDTLIKQTNLEEFMTSEQIKKAKNLALSWKKNH